jgi:hypothetical protein
MLVVSGFRTRVGKWGHGREHVGKLLTAEDAEVSHRARRKSLERKGREDGAKVAKKNNPKT